MTPDDPALEVLSPTARARNGLPDQHDLAAGERAAGLVAAALRPVLQPGGLRFSPLGPGWSGDLDAHVLAPPEEAPLRDAGWLPLDRLLGRLGQLASGRWAVTEGTDVLASLDITTEPVPEPVAVVLKRCRTRGQVRIREVLELSSLLRSGFHLPSDDAVVRVAADQEWALGGSDLAAWRSGGPRKSPARLRTWLARSVRQFLGQALLRQRYVVVLEGEASGVRSAAAQALATLLCRCGLPTTLLSWPGGTPATPPGMMVRAARARFTRGVLIHDGAPPGCGHAAAHPSRLNVPALVCRLLLPTIHARLWLGTTSGTVELTAFEALSTLLADA